MLLSPQHFTSHPPVDGIRAVVVEKLSTGRLQEGYRGGRSKRGSHPDAQHGTHPPQSRTHSPHLAVGKLRHEEVN